VAERGLYRTHNVLSEAWEQACPLGHRASRCRRATCRCEHVALSRFRCSTGRSRQVNFWHIGRRATLPVADNSGHEPRGAAWEARPLGDDLLLCGQGEGPERRGSCAGQSRFQPGICDEGASIPSVGALDSCDGAIPVTGEQHPMRTREARPVNDGGGPVMPSAVAAISGEGSTSPDQNDHDLRRSIAPPHLCVRP
jgi:hypothetical protein